MQLKTYPGDDIADVSTRAVRAAIDNVCPVTFEFNGHTFCAVPDTPPDSLVQAYVDAMDEASAVYRASGAYARQQAEREVKERARVAALAAALADAPAQMTLKDPQGWAAARAANPDDYGSAALDYAERWARVMEARIQTGAKVADIENECSHLADSEGISGFMHHCARATARATLRQVWLYGNALL